MGSSAAIFDVSWAVSKFPTFWSFFFFNPIFVLRNPLEGTETGLGGLPGKNGNILAALSAWRLRS